MATEIATLPLKAGSNIEDPNASSHGVWQSVLDTIATQDGYQRLYWGRRVEAPNEISLLIDWDSVDSHKQFQNSPQYGPFTKHLGSLLDLPASLHHANLSPHPPASTTSSSLSPVTECLTLYYSTDVNTSAFEEKWSTFRSALEHHASGYKASSAGWVVEELDHEGEKVKAFAIFVGWESVDAHMRYRETKEFKETIGLMREGLKATKMHHANFQAK